MIDLFFGDTLYGLILLLGLVTFFTRFAGHLVLSRPFVRNMLGARQRPPRPVACPRR